MLAILLVLGLLWRVLPSVDGTFPFMYDHAKDALSLLETISTGRPPLYGAVTSIPGVFNGPLPTYLFLPLFFILHMHPYANVLTVILLSLLGITFLWKKNRTAAMLYTFSAGVIGSQTSAWYPYLTSIFMIPVILVVLSVLERKKVTSLSAILLGLSAGFLFHAQTAFAITIPVVLAVIFMLHRHLITKKTILLILVAFATTFTPFLLFDIRHGFHQTRAILQFVLHFQTASQEVAPMSASTRVLDTFNMLLEAGGKALLPVNFSATINIAFALLITCLNFLRNSKKMLRVWLPFLLIPTLVYLVLPVKPYYFVGLSLVWVFLFAELLSKLPSSARVVLLVVYFFMSIYQTGTSVIESVARTRSSTDSWLVKNQSISNIRALQPAEPIRIFHIVPEVYDYPYQFIHLRNKLQYNYPLPSEFSYQPIVPEYVAEKRTILSRMQGTQSATKTYVLVEHNVQANWFDSKMAKRFYSPYNNIFLWELK